MGMTSSECSGVTLGALGMDPRRFERAHADATGGAGLVVGDQALAGEQRPIRGPDDAVRDRERADIDRLEEVRVGQRRS